MHVSGLLYAIFSVQKHHLLLFWNSIDLWNIHRFTYFYFIAKFGLYSYNGCRKKILSQWVEIYSSDLFNWAYHKVSDTELAKDLVQDTFLAAAEKMTSFRGDSSPKTWLFSILNYKIIDVYRKKVNQTINIDTQSISSSFNEEGSWLQERSPKDWNEDEAELLDNLEFREILLKCLDDLPGNWNASVRLKYLLNKSGEEICQELQITPTNLWQIVHRAKLRLRECVENNWFKK